MTEDAAFVFPTGDSSGIFPVVTTEASEPIISRTSTTRYILVYLALLALGVAGNLFRVELFFNVDLIFGSIATLIIVCLYGLYPGVLAAAIVAVPTVFLWDQPYALIVFTMEAAFVGLVRHKRRGNVLLIDAVYWLTFGFLLNLLVYGLLLRLSPDTMWVVILKQGVNGVVNALVAGVVVSLVPVPGVLRSSDGASASVSIKDAILYTITGFVVVPALLVFTMQSRMALETTEREVQDRLVSIGNAVELSVNQHIEDISNAMAAVARSWTEDDHSQESLGHLVRFGSDALTDVVSLRIADHEYKVHAQYPASEANGIQGLSAHDFDAVTATYVDEGLGVSSAVYYHGETPSLSIAMPWGTEDQPEAIVFGTLRMDTVQRQLTGLSEPWGLDATIVGPGDRVLLSTSADMELNEELRYMRFGSIVDVDGALMVHMPDFALDSPALQRWSSSRYMLRRDLSSAAGWALVLSAPLAPYQAALNQLSIQSLTVVFALVFGTIVLSRVFGIAIVGSLALLSEATTGLPARILESREAVSWPKTGIREAQLLINNFRDASDHIARNVHELQSINADLITATRNADAANRAKSRFLANMSHDLRTPLNGILGYAQLLSRDENLAPEYRDAVAIIEKSGDRLLNLLNDVLDLSRIEADRIERNDAAIDVDSLLSELTAMMRIAAEQKGIRLEQYLDPSLPQLIVCDEQKLQQILTNLVSNAIKFTDSGEVRVSARQAADPARILFEVSDTGVGIPEHEREAIFSPFIQGDKPRVDGEGTGLGLSIVKRLVEFLGGDVAVQSAVGTGTTFAVDIPLQQFTGSIAERPEIDAPGVYVDVSGYAGRTRSVLVADDADSNRRLLTDLLVPLGFSVDGASNGIEALESARQRKPDLIILDVVMPVAGGLEAFRSLQNDDELRDVPVIATSGSVAEQVRKECIRMGFAGFMEKPFHRDVVLGSIARVLNLEYTRRPSAGSREAADTQPVLTPSGSEARAIASALRRGDIRGILQAIEELARERPEYSAYCDMLTSLTRGFKIQSIADLLPEDSFES